MLKMGNQETGRGSSEPTPFSLYQKGRGQKAEVRYQRLEASEGCALAREYF